MYQQEIQFFWPLTEQIPLDLDYSNCVRPKITTSTIGPSSAVLSVAGGGVAWTTTSFRMQENETTMVVLKKPNFIRKFLFKMLGLKWEIK